MQDAHDVVLCVSSAEQEDDNHADVIDNRFFDCCQETPLAGDENVEIM